MTSSGVLYLLGDSVAQFGIEGKRFSMFDSEVMLQDRWNVCLLCSYCAAGSNSSSIAGENSKIVLLCVGELV